MAQHSRALKEQKTKQQIRVEQQFLYNLAQIIELFPNYTLAQHLTHFLRRKDDASQGSYFWNDELLLHKVESYYDELKDELINGVEEEY